MSVVARRRSEIDGQQIAECVGQSDVGVDGSSYEWPRPVYDGAWVDTDGVLWRMRGGQLDARQVRRLLKRPNLRVVWAYELAVVLVHGSAREELIAKIEGHFVGHAPPHSSFELGDFRDADHRVMLLIQESC